MGNSFNHSGDYRIEISGWGLDNSFFLRNEPICFGALMVKNRCNCIVRCRREPLSLFACWIPSLRVDLFPSPTRSRTLCR